MKGVEKYRAEIRYIAVITLVFLVLGILYQAGFFEKRIPLSSKIPKIAQVHRPLDGSPRGFAFDGRLLWISYPQSRRIVGYNTTSKEIARIIETPTISPFELGWRDGELLVSDTLTGKVLEIDSRTGRILGEHDLGLVYPAGLAHCDGRTFIYDLYTSQLVILDDRWTVVRRKAMPSILGLACGSGGLWLLLSRNMTIQLVSYETYEVLEGYYSPTIAATGLAWGNGRLWLGDFNNGDVYELVPGVVTYRTVNRGIPSWFLPLYAVLILPAIFSVLGKV